MTNLGHVFDASTGWEQRIGAAQLVDRLPGDRFANSLASIHPAARHALGRLNQPIDALPGFGGIAALSAPALTSFVERRRIDLIHAWGVQAGVAARMLPRTPLVVQIFDPLVAAQEVKRLRALARPEGFAVVCSSETVRRRLIEGGLAAGLAVVIRPGVDFSLINRFRRDTLRERLRLRREDLVVIVPEPAARSGGQWEACLAASLHHHFSGGVRIIVPGVSREQQRIARFISSLPLARALMMPGDRYPFEQLLAVSDVLLVTPRSDISTTSIAWAMASGVAVIGTAGYAIAELIAHRVNGLLFKQVRGRSMTVSILKVLRDRAAQQKVKEAARGQAYEVFGLRRYVEQSARLYENVLNRAAPGDGIVDSAIKA